MHCSKSSGHICALVACLMMLVTLPVTTIAADDDYLSVLSEEADSLETLGNARRERDNIKSTVRKQRQGETASKVVVVSAKGMRQLETDLMQYFPASYQLYQRLNNNERQQVYSEYTKGANKSHDARIFAAINRIIILQVNS